MSLPKKTLLLASLTLLESQHASGFAPPRPSFGMQQTGLFATIYNPSFDEHSDTTATTTAASDPSNTANAWLYEDDDSSTSAFDYNSVMPKNAFELAASITQSQLAQLARLAVAFSPPAQQLALQNINEVQVLNVNENSIEIEAVVCDEEQCVTLAVPVAFPIACVSVEDKDCIMGNIETLGQQADYKIQEQDHVTSLENDEDYMLLQQRLFATDNLQQLPSWWVVAGVELQQSCDAMRDIVSREDFSNDIQQLAMRQLDPHQSNHNLVVEQAVVVSICPTGMYLRAVVAGQQDLVDVAVPFQAQAMDDAALKTAVLDAVTGPPAQQQQQDLNLSSSSSSLEEQLTPSPDQLTYPDWWQPATDLATEDVCNRMLQVMNQGDFDMEVRALAMQDLAKSHHHHHHHDQIDYVVELAAVVAVCPTGMYVRAIAKPVEILEEHPARIVDVTLEFDYKAETADSLHAAVLGMVAAAASAYS